MPLLKHVCTLTGHTDVQLFAVEDRCSELYLPEQNNAVETSSCCAKLSLLEDEAETEGCHAAPQQTTCAELYSQEDCGCCHTEHLILLLPEQTPQAQFVGLFVPSLPTAKLIQQADFKLASRYAATLRNTFAQHAPPPLSAPERLAVLATLRI